MDHRPLQNVLQLFRTLKSSGGTLTAAKFIERLLRASSDDEAETLKVASHVVEQAYLARTVIDNSNLTDEAKSGVVSSINQLIRAFSISGMHSQWNSAIKNVDGSISNLVILLSAIQLTPTSPAAAETESLLTEIGEMLDKFASAGIDPAVRDVGVRHITILQGLLRNVSLFGVEAALTTYFELVLKLRRGDAGASEKARAAFDDLFVDIQGWGPKLTEIDKAYNADARVIADMAKPMNLLEYIPQG